MKVYRQGDVLIKRVKAVPQTTANKRESGILAFGEVTGHCHKVENLNQAEVLEVGTDLYLRVSEDGVRIVHDEHAPIMLPAGNYEITIQREYSPEEIRNVAD
jgi:capsular polysaccharide biosynthesis protein